MRMYLQEVLKILEHTKKQDSAKAYAFNNIVEIRMHTKYNNLNKTYVFYYIDF